MNTINLYNKSSSKGIVYEYVDRLPIDVEAIIMYKGFEYENYYIDCEGDIWFDNGEQYRKLHVNSNNCVSMIDINHVRHNLGIKGIRREFAWMQNM